MNKSFMMRMLVAALVTSAVMVSSCKKEEVDPVIKVDRVKYYTGHEYVDLGLSVFWAATNVGADSAHQAGDFYAWREITQKDVYDLNNYAYVASRNEADSVIDVARATWRGIWRTPSADQCRELLEECEWKWGDSLGTPGYKVTGVTGNSIFLPAAGLMDGDKIAAPGVCGNYWTNEVVSLNMEVATSLYLHPDTANMRYDYRYRGLSVRPVARNLYKELGVKDTFDSKPSASSDDKK